MGRKIGRNEPCPCGSGKKYKKCCGLKERMDFSLPEDCLTGTRLDDYLYLYQGVALFAERIARFEKEGKELKKTESEYKKKFRPRKYTGIPLSMFMSWLHFDFRFGESQETVCERFIKSPFFTRLIEPGPTHLKQFSESYCTFYEIQDIFEDHLLLYELGTGKRWHVIRINEPFEREAAIGDLWYLRLLGTPAEAYIFTPPFIYPSRTKSFFSKLVTQQVKILLKDDLAKTFPKKDLFKESCKATLPAWSDFFLGNISEIFSHDPEFERDLPEKPILCNTDGEPLSFSTVYFRVKDKTELQKRLSSLRGFDYDEKQKEWIWLKEDKRKIKIFKRTVLGNLSLKKDRLVGETNSIERAVRLKDILTRELRGTVSYEKMESKSLDSMPKPTKEEMKKFEKEQERLYSNPEIRKKLIEEHENYYLKEWIRSKVPALGNQTPLEAVKTEEGRFKVKKLLDTFQLAEQNAPSYKPRFDFNKLRKKLGLPPMGN